MHYDENADVGLLEISESVALKSTLRFLSQTNILQNRRKTEKAGVLLEGYPSEFITPIHREKVKGKNCQVFLQQQFMYVGRLLPNKEWPAKLAGLPLLKRRDLLIPYSPDITVQGVNLNNFSAKIVNLAAPNLKGMSGCGIWLLSMNVSESSGIWKPDAQLIGIQRSFNNIIRGTQITRWVALVRKHYPDLQQELDSLK